MAKNYKYSKTITLRRKGVDDMRHEGCFFRNKLMSCVSKVGKNKTLPTCIGCPKDYIYIRVKTPMWCLIKGCDGRTGAHEHCTKCPAYDIMKTNCDILDNTNKTLQQYD
jgi:hypothetical protein